MSTEGTSDGGKRPIARVADLGALPTTHWGVRAFGRSRMRITIFNRPAADLGAVQPEGEQSPDVRGGEAVRARRGASQTLFEEVGDRLGPSGGVVTARGSRNPELLCLSRAGAEVIGKECIEAAGGEAELLGGFGGPQGVLPEGSQHMTDEGGCVAIG